MSHRTGPVRQTAIRPHSGDRRGGAERTPLMRDRDPARVQAVPEVAAVLGEALVRLLFLNPSLPQVDLPETESPQVTALHPQGGLFPFPLAKSRAQLSDQGILTSKCFCDFIHELIANSEFRAHCLWDCLAFCRWKSPMAASTLSRQAAYGNFSLIAPKLLILASASRAFTASQKALTASTSGVTNV